MKVIYKKTVLDHALEAIAEAKRLGREIEKIQVTPEEFNALIRANRPVCSITWQCTGYTLNGVLIDVVASTGAILPTQPAPYGRFEGR